MLVEESLIDGLMEVTYGDLFNASVPRESSM
jgi:hypothetical protein